MEREKLESLLIDYIDNLLSPADRQAVEQKLKNNPEARELYEQLREVMESIDRSVLREPSPMLRQKFEAMLEREMASPGGTAKSVTLNPGWYKVAAAITLLVTGVGLGIWIGRDRQYDEELVALRKEMQTTKMLMLELIENNQSASQRLRGVNVALSIKNADKEVVDALLKTMNEDPNTNVRLAALEALSNYHHEPAVRKALIAALGTQKDPVVQIALIQLMVRIRESSVINTLKRITTDSSAIQAVKDEAYSGILKLS